MKAFLALLLPAYGVTLIAVPLSLMLDHLGRGATLWRAILVLPLWILSAAWLSLPFALLGAGLAFLLQRLGGNWWKVRYGRALFAVTGAVLGGAILLPAFPGYALAGAAAGGTAAWVAHSPAGQPRRRRTLVVAMGLVAGMILGLRFY